MRPVAQLRVGVALASCFLLTGCGKKGPLIYPDLLVPEAPQAVQLEQRGDSLQLAFDLPARDRSGRALKDPFVLQVQRRELNVDERGECGECPKDYQPARRIDPEFPDPAMKFGKRLVLLDPEVSQGKRYQYRLVAVTSAGDSGVPAETVRAMVCAVPAAPTITAKVVHGGTVVLELQGEVPDNAELVGYALYRAAGDEPMPFLPLVTTLGRAQFEDQTVQQGVVYRYAARMVLRRWDELLVSSELSSVTTINPSSDFSK